MCVYVCMCVLNSERFAVLRVCICMNIGMYIHKVVITIWMRIPVDITCIPYKRREKCCFRTRIKSSGPWFSTLSIKSCSAAEQLTRWTKLLSKLQRTPQKTERTPKIQSIIHPEKCEIFNHLNDLDFLSFFTFSIHFVRGISEDFWMLYLALFLVFPFLLYRVVCIFLNQKLANQNRLKRKVGILVGLNAFSHWSWDPLLIGSLRINTVITLLLKTWIVRFWTGFGGRY